MEREVKVEEKGLGWGWGLKYMCSVTGKHKIVLYTSKYIFLLLLFMLL